MPKDGPSPLETWYRLKPDAVHAAEALYTQLTAEEESADDLVDAYLFAKRTLADSLRALLEAQISDTCVVRFRELRDQLGRLIFDQYANSVPEKYLRVPYGSRVHEELFAFLLQHQGKPVQAAVLRIITADSVHTERRVRELRELGLDIHTSNVEGANVYTLSSLELDEVMIPSIVENLIKKDKTLSKRQMEMLISRLR